MDVESEGTKAYSYWGLWGTLAWAGVLTLVFVVMQSLVVGVYIGMVHQDNSTEAETLIQLYQYNGTALSLATLVSLLVCGSLILVIIKFKKNTNIKHYLALRSVRFLEARNWLFVVVLLLVIADIAARLLDNNQAMEFMAPVFQSAQPQWLIWLAIVIAAPVLEELFFRGFLFSGLAASSVGVYATIFLTALFWAVIHLQYDYFGMMVIFLLGIVFGLARLKSQSVYLPMGLHAFVNLVATIETAIYVS